MSGLHHTDHTSLRQLLPHLLQVSDEDDAAKAVELADRVEAAIASELILPEKHGLIPDQNNLLFAEIE